MKTERILSVIFAILAPLPLMITAATGGNGRLVFYLLAIYAAQGGLAWLVGALPGLLLKAVPETVYYGIKLLSIVAGAIVIILCGWILILLESNTATMIFVPLAVVFCYWFGYRLGSGRELLPSSAIWVYCVETVLSYPMCAAFEDNDRTGSVSILVMAALMTVMGAVIINIRHLEDLSWQGGGKELKLSRATVRFNLKKTLTFSGAVLFLFCFAGFGARWLWEGLKAFIRWLLELLKNLGQSIDIEPFDPELAPPEAIEENDNLLWQILSVVIIAVILILFIKPLIRHLKRLIEYIKERLSVRSESENTYEASYVDTYEESERYSYGSNTFRKAYRAFAREKDLTVKYRLGYRAFMLLLGRKNENAPSDTTMVHLVRGRIYDDTLAENVIGKYERLRYHRYSPTKEDCEELDRLLKTVQGSR